MSSEPLYDPTAAETLADPYLAYARLRDEAPAYYIEKWDTWAISRFEDIWKYSNSHEHFSATFGTAPPYFIGDTLAAGINLNHMDPPQHMSLRSALLPKFLPPSIQELESTVRSFIAESLEALISAGGGDACEEIGQVVGIRVASEIIGFPREDEALIRDFLGRIFKSIGAVEGTEEMAATAFGDMRSYLTEQAAARRGYSGEPENLIDTLFSSLDVAVSDEEMGEHLMPLFFGATETFPKLTTAALYRLWQHPDQRAVLAANPDGILAAVRECLRYDMPTQMSMRKVVNDLELHGETLRAGSSVMFMWAAANRDEREFVTPDSFDTTRKVRRSLSFGHGIHRCLGANLAELEGRLLIEEMLRLAPDYEIDESGVTFESTAFFNAFTHLPLKF